MNIFFKITERNTETVVQFNPIIKWIALLLIVLLMVFSATGLVYLAVITLLGFVSWLALFLWQTKGIRALIRSNIKEGTVKASGSAWSWKNPETYVLGK